MLCRRLASIVSLGALSLLGACAAGVEDGGFGVLSGAHGGPSDDSSSGGTEGESEEGDGSGGPGSSTGSQPPPPSDDGSSGDDGGNALCCEPHAEPGCGSPTTESCVCASQPSCCQNVWGQGCVDLAIACGDPFCAGEPGDGSSTGDPVEPPDPPPEPPEEPPPEEPEVPWPSCPCLGAPGIDNFCHYGPSYPGCPMTAPGGYCDPNGDAAFDEGDWDQGWYDWHDQCA